MEHIKTIEINNFKSIRHLKMEGCRRINVLIGPPNVGKSNILEALGCYAFASPNFQEERSAKSIFRMDILPNLFHNLDIKTPFSIDINDKSLQGSYNRGYVEPIKEIKNSREEIQEYIDVKCIEKNSNHPLDYIFGYTIYKDLRFSNLSLNGYKLDSKNNFHYPARNIIKYNYNNDRVGKKGSKYLDLISPFGDNLFSFLQYDDRLKAELEDFLKEFGLELLFDEKEEMLKVIKKETKSLIPFDLLADTIKRLFFYKAAISANKKSVLIFEEPEAHSFPPYISKLVSDIIFDKNENQYFIATHSPYVLNDFLENAQDDLALYIINQQDGNTVSAHLLNSEEIHEAYQYGYDFFLNMENFRPEQEVYA